MNRRGWDFGTTSDNPTPLRRDDGGPRQFGAVRTDHAVDREHNNPRRGAGFANPEKDYGPKDLGSSGHIDGTHTRPQYPAGAGYGKQREQYGPVKASNARALRTSASETWMGQWFGYPARRQGG
jgi:hypothetical protein